MTLTAISLFSSGGIGDLALKKNNIHILLANELKEDRVAVFKYNYPETYTIQGDINILKFEIVRKTNELLKGRVLDIVYATPPCQGMSKNGKGKLLQGIRNGIKPRLDERNSLIIPTIDIIKELQPRLVFFENVPEMQNTLIESADGNFINIIDYIKQELVGYIGKAEVVEFADYGVPQKRQRLITIFTKEENIKKHFSKSFTFLPPTTHSEKGFNDKQKWVTVRDTIENFPKLDAKNKKSASSDIPYHCVPLLDKDKYYWVSNTPPEKGAFDNQCIKCGYKFNPTHGASRNEKGINQANKDTPIKCMKCNELLPRPWVKKDGEYRLMSGFTSAYKRMKWDNPASALTRNLSYACSDHKLHPVQNRVLSLYEAFHIHTVADFEYYWRRTDGKKVADKTVRDIIGESIPPKGLSIIFNHLVCLLTDSDLDNVINIGTGIRTIPSQLSLSLM